jgi:uracil-DNA glycosylase family 4
MPERIRGSALDDATPESIARLLRWWSQAGVDIALDPEPHNRFQESRRAAPPAPQLEAAGARGAATPAARSRPADMAAPAEAALEARALADSANTLDELHAALERFDGCALKFTATQLVFCDGAPDAKIMFVGEAPGGDEDRIGRPFVGRAGQLLDRMLGAIGLDRTRVHIANVVPWRPPGNRTPTPQETSTCLPFIRRHIELVCPRVLICLGGSSAQTLLGIKEGITRARGQWFDYPVGAASIKAIPMFHPAYLLRQPAQKRAAWRDLRALAKYLGELDAPAAR